MNERLLLNMHAMNVIHKEFLDMLPKINSCEESEFLTLFEELIEQTKERFSYEEHLMIKHGYYAMKEHTNEHIVLLEEMELFYTESKKIPSFAKSYIQNYAQEKFMQHLLNSDAQLATYLKELGVC